MRGHFIRWGLLTGLILGAVYFLHGDTSIPKFVLESIRLLKKPIEDLLPDLRDTTSTEQSDADRSLDLEPYQELRFSRERWNEMRQIIEAGKPIYTPLPSEVVISTVPTGRLAPAVPPPPGFSIVLPYESRLTVSGRKVIGIAYKSTQYTNPTFANQQTLPTSQNNFELQQQLQVRINGVIGRKVTVNVDFDDTKTDKKDISIVYKGDPDEVVQRAAFGDINLSLPQTEFVGYNKQVFGASAELKYKALHGYLIGSRTKGQSETKEFNGNIILQRVDIPDTSYIRRKFYNLTPMTGIKGIELNTETVLLDTQDTSRPPATFFRGGSLPVDGSLLGPSFSTFTYTGNFIQLSRGIDYTVDATLGVITLRNPLASNHVVAIDYKPKGESDFVSNTRGVRGQFKIVKFDETRTLQIPITEDLTHYNIGTNKIVRDNGQGNFILKLLDLNRNDVGSSVSVNYLPNNSGNIFVDFEAGTFNLQDIRLDTRNPSFSDIYNPSPNHRFTFFTEFRARVKTYTLRPNIVLNSERITLNGRLLSRDKDYFIDYESGFVTFFNEDQITESSRIVATYDFSPFGIAGALQDTLVGERTEFSFYPLHPLLSQSFIGSSVIYDFAPKQAAAPDIRQTAGSFLVTEGDIHFKNLVFDPLPMLKSSFAAEIARSERNPNAFGKAIIDNMEGIKDETSVGLNLLNWQVASNPSARPAFYNAMAGGLVNETVTVLSINPQASALSTDRQQVLDINYDLTVSTEASIVTVLSPTGLDFSKKLFLEMFIQGDGSTATSTPSGTQLNVTMGQIDEDADGTGGGGFTDINGFHPRGDRTPRTEDLNHNNTLDVGEDIGWTYFNPDGSSVQVGANNFRLDSEDLDRNGILDRGNPLVGGNVGYQSPVSTFTVPNDSTLGPGGSNANTVDFQGWRFIRIPLNIGNNAPNWTSIKELRLSLKARGSGPGTRGTIKIGKIVVVGNKWQPEPFGVTGSTSTLNVFAINNEDDLNHVPPYVSPQGFPDFDALNQVNTSFTGPTPNKRREQSLGLGYVFDAFAPAGSSVTAKSVTVSPMDFTIYGSLRFFLYGDGNRNNGEVFFFRAGSDNNFLEYRIPVTWTGWRELTIRQIDPTGHQQPTTWQSGDADGATSTTGSPNLASVSQLKVGVLKTTSGAQSGELWFDELHAADVITRVGYAGRLQSDFEVLGWGGFGASVKDIDRNFQTFNSPMTNQDRHEANGYLNATRLAYFPMKFTGSKRRTLTPNVQTISNSSLVSVLQEGRVDERSFAGTGTLQIPRTPKLGLLYDTNTTETSLLFRTDKTDHYGTTLDYTIPLNRAYIPKTVQLGYKRTLLDLSFTPGALRGASDAFAVSNTRDKTDDVSGKLSFQPITGFTFNPNYSLSTTREFKDAIVDSRTLTTTFLEYDKTKAQTVGADGVLAFKRWFSPRLRYSITNRETFGIPLSADRFASQFKTVDRTATGETAWDFSYRDFSSRWRALQSLNVSSSYLIENGDSWERVNGGDNTLWALWVPNGLSSGNRRLQTLRDTFRSTQRWSPFDWATSWSGFRLPWRTLALTSTYTDTKQRQETTGTPSKILTRIVPDLIFSLTQTEHFFHAQNYMSNSQLNLKTQYKTVDTVNTSLQKVLTNGGDWRFTLWRKLDLFFTYTRTTDTTFDRVNSVVSNDGLNEVLGAQVGFNVGKFRITPKYDQSTSKAVNASGRLTTDLVTRTPAVQVYADLFLPAGLQLPFSDLIVFSNRIRSTSTLSLTQKRSSLNGARDNTDTYAINTSEDYELTSNIRLTFGGGYSYQVNKANADANFYSYEFNSLLTIQF